MKGLDVALIVVLALVEACGGRSVNSTGGAMDSDQGGGTSGGNGGGGGASSSGGRADEAVPVTQLSVAWGTCALFADGSIRCWGYGALGYEHENVPFSPGPAVELDARATAVEMGRTHTCALLEGGTVRCWGNNQYGQLGYDDTMERTLPGPGVDLAAPAVALAAGVDHTCALLEGGAVWCWGYNEWGQLGDSTPGRYLPAPTVDLGAPAIALDSGHAHTCALLEGGSVRCWGENVSYQLGNTVGSTSLRVPYDPGPPVKLDAPAIAISCGSSHSCALLEDGGIRCWGDNEQGSLGCGDIADRIEPCAVDVGGPADALIASDFFTCAVLRGGSVRCWGFNSAGELGYGDESNRTLPGPPVDLGGPATELASGSHTCALLADGSVRCWGFRAGDANANYYDRETHIGDDPDEMPPPAVQF